MRSWTEEISRREFLAQSAGLVAVGLAACAPMAAPPAAPTAAAGPPADAAVRDLLLRALDAARRAGASYADARVVRNRSQTLVTRERQVVGLSDAETYGIGVRVLVGGAWGFAATRELTAEAVERVARQAVAQGRANAAARRQPVELAPAPVVPDGRWRTPGAVDPFDVSLETKIAALLAANEAALRVPGVRFVTSRLAQLREEKTFASTEGTFTHQVIFRIYPSLTVTAVAADGSDFQSRQSTEVAPAGRGWEYVAASRFVERAPQWAEEAVAKLSARPVEPGRYDLVLLPSHLWLTIHESIAHPTELDRIYGYEANYAGTSFIHPPLEAFLGRFRYGPPIMNIQGERSSAGGLATAGYDDEGVVPDTYLIIREGILWDLQTTREQAPWLADWYRRTGREVRSHGNSYAESWAAIQFQRMPNVNLLPHPERDVSLEELLDGVRDGILIEGDGSYSIDQQRYNAQFGGQVFWRIRNGRRAEMLKDVAYQMRTPDFWNSMDLIGGPSTYAVGGSFTDGKGQPSQANAVSHGCPAARFRNVTVLNTGRRG